jgi:hypothetical protein
MVAQDPELAWLSVASAADFAALSHGTIAIRCSGNCSTYLPRLVSSTRVRALDLSACAGLGNADLEALEDLPLSLLILAGCDGIGDEGLRHVAHVASLTSLDLSMCNLVTDSGVAALSALKHLQCLDLSWCYSVSDASIQVLSALQALSAVYLVGCERITDCGVQVLAGMPQLRTLSLPGLAAISDDGLRALGTGARRLQHLEFRHLDYVTDAGLSSLSECQELVTVSLTGCRHVTDVGLSRLAALGRLRSLTVHECPLVTPAGIAALRAAAPGLEDVDFVPAKQLRH